MADSHAKVDLVLERVAAVREACGKEFGIAVDFHGRVHRAIAKVLTRALEPYHLLFIEEPVLPENLDALSEVARVTSMPLATGSGFIPAGTSDGFWKPSTSTLSSPICPMRGEFRRSARSRRWPRPMMWRPRPTAHSARLR